MNELLKQQLENSFTNTAPLPVEWHSFLQAVSATYDKLSATTNGTYTPPNTLENDLKQHKTLTALTRTEVELGRILDSVNHGFFSRNMETDTYTFLSAACERIYGYPAAAFMKNKRLWYEVIHPDDKAMVDNDNERLRNNNEVCSQYRIIAGDNSVKWIEITIIPFIEDGSLLRIDGVVNDITKRKEAEQEREAIIEELIRTNADLKQFSYITSHNLRSPLTNIQGIINLFQFDANDTHNKQMLDMLRASAATLKTTVDDLTQVLIIKNNKENNSESIQLNEIYQNALHVFSHMLEETGATITTNFAAPALTFSKIYIESIFINLISNAIKYRSPHRPLVIHINSSQTANGDVQLTFRDNGIGIDLSRHSHKIFGLYQRFHSNIEGRGLGLFIVKSQVEASGGKIIVESEPNVGTTFIITLKQ